MSPSARIATLPFRVSADHQVIGGGSVTTTEERRHGVLRLERETLVVQWRVEREIQRVGPEIRTDIERAGLREVSIALRMLGDARVIERRRWWWRRHEIVLTARDLVAFDQLSNEDGFSFDHPAKLVLPVQRVDLALAQEFASEVELAIAELALADVEQAPLLPPRQPSLVALPTTATTATTPAPLQE